MKVNILQFVNDIIFFRKVIKKNIKVIKKMLRCYELVLRLKVNYHKSIPKGF